MMSSDDELSQVIGAVEVMTPRQLTGFKQQLGIVHRQSVERRNVKRRTYSVFGRMLLDASRRAKDGAK